MILFASLFGFGSMIDPLFEKQIRAVREAEDPRGDPAESGDPPAD